MLHQPSKLKLNDPTLLREANLIGGKWLGADNGKTIDILNPATGVLVGRWVPARVGRVPAMGAAETRRAIRIIPLRRWGRSAAGRAPLRASR